MAEGSTPTLKDHLLASLKHQARGKRAFELSILRSQPKRSYALFPWASDASAKVYVEYELLVLSEKVHTTAAYVCITEFAETCTNVQKLQIRGFKQ